MAQALPPLPRSAAESPIRAVVLDWGGVMSNSGRAGQVGENLAAALGIEPKEGARLMNVADAELKRGLASEEQFWQAVEQAYGSPIGEDQRHIWIPASDLAPHPDMVAEVVALRSAGYQVGLLTNTHPAASRAVESIGGYKGFDAVVQSDRSLSHSAKPEPAAYLEILGLLGVAADRAVMVDDQDKGLRGAAEVGMLTLRADPRSPAFPLDLRRDLRAFLARTQRGGATSAATHRSSPVGGVAATEGRSGAVFHHHPVAAMRGGRSLAR